MSLPVLPAVVFLTGLSGAGKTTLSKALQHALLQLGVRPVLLDGDEVRNAVQLDAFDADARKKHNRTVGALAALFESQGHVVIVSLIAPYAATRNEVRQLCKQFHEVYVDAQLDTCIQRDPKGLYAKALRGDIQQFTGISAPYEAPTAPELVLHTDNTPIAECTQQLLQLLKVNV